LEEVKSKLSSVWKLRRKKGVRYHIYREKSFSIHFMKMLFAPPELKRIR